MSLLEVRDLKTYFFTRWGTVKAVDGVSFTLNQGETLGIVGESGCGKSITALSLVRLVPEPAGKIVGGEVLLNGDDLLRKSKSEMRRLRGKHITMILQDPMSSLNPVFKIGNQVAEGPSAHLKLRGRALMQRVVQLLRQVEIPAAAERTQNFPHQLSGGMRQRVVGAIALSCEPQLLIADEPTTSLDVTIQLQYLSLLKKIQEETGLAIIFITHDFGIAANMCDRVAVMYAGKIVERGTAGELFRSPQHPYTRALMGSIPSVEAKNERLDFIQGEPPRLYDLPLGCAFQARCTEQIDACKQASFPPHVELSKRHWVSCWRVG